MKNIKKMSDEKLRKELQHLAYRVSTIRNLIYTAIMLGVLSLVVAVGAFLFEETLTSNVFSVAGLLQSVAIAGFLGAGARLEGKRMLISRELELRDKIAKETQEFQASNDLSKSNQNEFINKTTTHTQDDNITKGL